jgi:hypothetical protein
MKKVFMILATFMLLASTAMAAQRVPLGEDFTNGG